jgi:acetyltransferase-like isoleucine patch superfamily enzyme
MKKMSKLISLIRSLPKTMYFNFRVLPWRHAVKLPVLVSHRVYLSDLSGSIKLTGPIAPAMIKIGFGHVGIFDKKQSRSIWDVSGCVTFKGVARLGHGTKVSVSGDVIFGNNMVITAESQIVCRKQIIFGDNVLVSWDNLFMDTDFHEILDDNGNLLNADRSIIIGDHVWFGARCLVLKGVCVGQNNIIAAGTILHDSFKLDKSVIGGNPTRIIRTDVIWRE